MQITSLSSGLSDRPFLLFVCILGLVSTIELFIMLVLPVDASFTSSRFLIGLLDSAALSILLMPLFWWMLILPLRRVADVRLGLIDWSQRRQEEMERQIAGNLHDEVGQLLTGISLGLRSIRDQCPDANIQPRLDELTALVKQAHRSIRQLARELRPATLDQLGLEAGLRTVLDGLKSSGIREVTLQIDPQIQDRQLPLNLETAIFRIVQESSLNCMKHSKAERFHVAIERFENVVRLVVSDNGKGFDVDQALRQTGSERPFGLLNMIERTKLLGGNCKITSTPLKGTRLEAQILIPKSIPDQPKRRQRNG